MQDAFMKTLWAESFGTMMAGAVYFLSYKWTVMGFHISLLNAVILWESFDLIMTKIGQIFGKEEVSE